jgi:hypothetical protein
LNCGKFIVLNEPLAIDADVDGNAVTLHAKVGRILCIARIGDSQRILLSLLFFASEFPIPWISEEAKAPDRRRYVEYPTHVVLRNIVKWIPATSNLSKAFVFKEKDLLMMVQVIVLWNGECLPRTLQVGEGWPDFPPNWSTGLLIISLPHAIHATTGTFWFEFLH